MVYVLTRLNIYWKTENDWRYQERWLKSFFSLFIVNSNVVHLMLTYTDFFESLHVAIVNQIYWNDDTASFFSSRALCQSGNFKWGVIISLETASSLTNYPRRHQKRRFQKWRRCKPALITNKRFAISSLCFLRERQRVSLWIEERMHRWRIIWVMASMGGTVLPLAMFD